MIKALYLDFDGTTYSHSQNRIPSSAALSLKKAQEKNIRVFLTTGRSIPELQTFDFNGIEFDGYIIDNGQAIFDKELNLLYSNPLKGILLEKILFYFKEKKTPIIINTPTDIFINMHNDHVKKVQDSINTALPRIKEYENEDIIMASVFMKDKKTVDEFFSLKDIAELTWWNDGAIDIVPTGSSKARGVQIMNGILGISKEECIAFGDGDNDIEMMKYCSHSVAMGNSIDTVKETAEYVTSHIDEDGMKNALEHYKLI